MDVLRQARDGCEPLLVSARQAAAMLSVSPRTLNNLRARGEVPSIKIGKSRRYPVDGLREFIAARLKGAAR